MTAPATFVVKTNVPLYGFDHDGSFFEGGFDGRPQRLIARHETEGSPSVALSTDERWVAYGGSSKLSYKALFNNIKAEQVWLYDRTSRSHRLVLERPSWTSGMAGATFSPDSRWLALFSSYDSRHPADQSSGLYLIDVASGRAHLLGYPPGHVAKKGLYGFPSWSRDGRRLLLHTIEGGTTRHYFSIDPASKDFQAISGHFDKQSGETTFASSTKAIPLKRDRSMQSRFLYVSIIAANGMARASIDKGYRLLLTGPSRQTKVIARGTYEQCEGRTINILGWVDGSRYLIYEISSTPYIVEVTTGHSKRLQLGKILKGTYFW